MRRAYHASLERVNRRVRSRRVDEARRGFRSRRRSRTRLPKPCARAMASGLSPHSSHGAGTGGHAFQKSKLSPGCRAVGCGATGRGATGRGAAGRGAAGRGAAGRRDTGSNLTPSPKRDHAFIPRLLARSSRLVTFTSHPRSIRGDRHARRPPPTSGGPGTGERGGAGSGAHPTSRRRRHAAPIGQVQRRGGAGRSSTRAMPAARRSRSRARVPVRSRGSCTA